MKECSLIDQQNTIRLFTDEPKEMPQQMKRFVSIVYKNNDERNCPLNVVLSEEHQDYIR